MDNFIIKMCAVCLKKTKKSHELRLELSKSIKNNIIYCCPLCLEYFACLSFSSSSTYIGYVYCSEILPLFLRINDKSYVSDEIISSYAISLSIISSNPKYESSSWLVKRDLSESERERALILSKLS